MEWKDFNKGELEITNAGQVLTDIRCPECGRFIFMGTTIVLASYPAQYSYWCACGWSGTSYKSWFKKKPYKVVVGFNMDRCDESAKAIFEKDVINVKNVNGLYGAHVNTCEDCELFATPTEPIRGIYCARAQRFVCQHNPACKDFEPQTKEESDE